MKIDVESVFHSNEQQSEYRHSDLQDSERRCFGKANFILR